MKRGHISLKLENNVNIRLVRFFFYSCSTINYSVGGHGPAWLRYELPKLATWVQIPLAALNI